MGRLALQEFLTLLRMGGVPVSPAAGLPSGPRPTWAPLEKRNVVGRGLRRAAQQQRQQQGDAVDSSCEEGAEERGAGASARCAVPGVCGCAEGSDGEVVMADVDASSAASGDPRLGDARAVESMVAAMDSDRKSVV